MERRQLMDAPVVIIKGHKYVPPTIEVAPGSKVIWDNQDKVTHTATANDGSWTTGDIPGGGSREVTFPNPGTYPYYCEHHPSMTGTVAVK
jgi:plastocyanin